MKKFREFMKAHGVWDEYKRNVKLCPWFKNVTQYIASSNELVYMHGFDWGYSSRGFNFWRNLSQEWRDSL